MAMDANAVKYIPPSEISQCLKKGKESQRELCKFIWDRVKCDLQYSRALEEWANKAKSRQEASSYSDLGYGPLQGVLAMVIKEAEIQAAQLRAGYRTTMCAGGPYNSLYMFHKGKTEKVGNASPSSKAGHPSFDASLPPIGGQSDVIGTQVRQYEKLIARHLEHVQQICETKKAYREAVKKMKAQGRKVSKLLKKSSRPTAAETNLTQLEGKSDVLRSKYHSLFIKLKKEQNDIIQEINDTLELVTDYEEVRLNFLRKHLVAFIQTIKLSCTAKGQEILQRSLDNLEELDIRSMIEQWREKNLRVTTFETSDPDDDQDVTHDLDLEPLSKDPLPGLEIGVLGECAPDDTRITNAERYEQRKKQPLTTKKLLTTKAVIRQLVKTASKADDDPDTESTGSCLTSASSGVLHTEDGAYTQVDTLSDSSCVSLIDLGVDRSASDNEVPMNTSFPSAQSAWNQESSKLESQSGMGKFASDMLNKLRTKASASGTYTEVKSFKDVTNMTNVDVIALDDYKTDDFGHLTFSKGQKIRQRYAADSNGLAWGWTRLPKHIHRKIRGFYPVALVELAQ